MLRTARQIGFAALAAVTTFGFAQIASAQTIPLAGESDDDWRFAVTAYAFLPARTQGTSTIAGSTVDLDLDFSEVLDLLDFALSARGEAWKGNWGIIGDFYTVKMSLSSDIGLPGPAGGSLGIDVDVEQKWVSLLGAYRFAQGTYGDAGRQYAWDASFGMRWNSIKQEVDASVDIGPGPGIQTTLGGTEDWWEPMVGIRGAYQVSDRWTVGGRAEFGGFGVGGDNLQYTLLIGADWQLWERTSLKFGYQYYSIDFETKRSDGAFAYDIVQHGPYIGISYRF